MQLDIWIKYLGGKLTYLVRYWNFNRLLYELDYSLSAP